MGKIWQRIKMGLVIVPLVVVLFQHIIMFFLGIEGGHVKTHAVISIVAVLISGVTYALTRGK